MKKSYAELANTIVKVACRMCAQCYETNALTIEMGDPYGLCGDCYLLELQRFNRVAR
jgi:hypothetical protein